MGADGVRRIRAWLELLRARDVVQKQKDDEDEEPTRDPWRTGVRI